MSQLEYIRKKHLNPYSPGVPIVDGRISNLRNLDKENLLKAADALDNPAYWTVNGITVTKPSEGIFRLTKTASPDRSIHQTLTNWFPQWGATFSFFFGVKTDGVLDRANVFMQVDAADVVTDAEKISGPGQVSVAASRANITFLENEWSFFRVTGTAKGWSTSVVVLFYPGGSQTVVGYADVVDFQLVLGNEIKPRPAGVGLDDWMMSYRPHNRLTGDNKGRIFTVDKINPIWIGTIEDGRLLPSDGQTGNSSSDFRTEFIVTVEDTRQFFSLFRNTDANNYLRVGITTSRVFQVFNRVGGVNETIALTTLNNAGRYRLGFEVVGSSWSAYVDDKLIQSGIFTDSANNSGTGHIISETMTSKAEYIIVEEYSRRNGGIISTGPGIGWGDCRTTITDPDGNAFDTIASSACLASLQQFAPTTGNFRVGLSATPTSLTPQSPVFEAIHNVNGPGVRDSGNIPLSPLDRTRVNRGELLHYMILKRADAKGGAHFFTNQNSGAEWKRIWVDEAGIASPTSCPIASNFDCIMYVTNLSLIDLSSRHENEFNDVTGSASSPAPDTLIDCEADFEASLTWTHETGNAAVFRFRVSGTSPANFFDVGAVSGNDLFLRRLDNDVPTNLYQGVGLLSDGVVANVKVVAEGSSIKLFLNNDLKIEVIDTKNQTVAQAGTWNSLATNDIAISTHPLSLGGALGATDRVIAPQFKDSFDFESDGMFIGRNIEFPSGADCNINLRNSGGDNQTLVHVVTNAGNNHQLRSTPGWATLIAAGSIVAGANIMSVFEGSDSEIFENGASDGSSAATPYEDQTGGDFRNQEGSKFDAFEAWPRNNNIFNPN